MKYLILCLFVLTACSKKYEVTRAIEGSDELTRYQVLIKKIHEKCVDYVVPSLRQEVIDSQVKWRDYLEERCRKEKEIVKCIRVKSNMRLDMLEHNCAIESNETASKNKPLHTYRYIANCGDQGCAGVDGNMSIWEVTPELIFIEADNNVNGSKCKCQLNGVKNNQGYFLKFAQPSSICDGTMSPTKIGYKIDIDSCGYCCGSKAGIRGEWKVRRDIMPKSEDKKAKK